MTRLDHRRRAQFDRMRQHGAENVDDAERIRRLLWGPLTPRQRSSKADLRREADQAVASFAGPVTRRVTCPECRREANIKIPADRLHVPMKCSQCGTVVQP